MPITWLDKIDGLDLNDPQKNVNAADMNQIKTIANATETAAAAANSAISTHADLTNNPHLTTKGQVGLANADNTSDVDKPVSTAQQAALNLKANIANPTFTGTVSGITKTMVGLSNVDNTSDATKLAAVLAMFVWGEVPSGTVDGVNDDFTIANSNPSKVALYLDGIRTNPSNFSITGTALTITNAGVIPTNSILIDYIK